jgi:hypothetical protein
MQARTKSLAVYGRNGRTQQGDMTMFSKTKIALAAVIVLSTAFAASAATKTQVTQDRGSAVYTMIPGYDRSGGVVAVPDPDHFGQPQLAGDQSPRNQ